MKHTTRDLTQAAAVADVRARLQDGRAKTVREASGLSQSEVARAIGVHASALSRWEAGSRAPRGDAALRLGRLLDRLEARP